MKVAFYRARCGAWRDWLIAGWTFGPFSHCELVFSDGNCFSSSAVAGCTRFKRIELDDKWIVVELDLDEETEAKIRDWCRRHSGLPYDWLGIFGTAISARIQKRGAWFCSEICITALKRFNVVRMRRLLSPNGLYRRLKRSRT